MTGRVDFVDGALIGPDFQLDRKQVGIALQATKIVLTAVPGMPVTRQMDAVMECVRRLKNMSPEVMTECANHSADFNNIVLTIIVKANYDLDLPIPPILLHVIQHLDQGDTPAEVAATHGVDVSEFLENRQPVDTMPRLNEEEK